ncbi:MAG TPA: DUF2336 domain-containing protein [Candidatus Cybelea sp.]|nr:DUF2336 domain-containing protein [Candidatus Cybelea sp.]
MASMLTEADVQRLMASPSSDVRADTAEKVAQAFGSAALTPAERQLAEAIFRVMVKDAEVMVREALARHLKSNPDLPKDVAVSLAKDVESVSLPVLEFSSVLSDTDLIEIARSAGAEKQAAIARRAEVSSAVAEALVDHGRTPGVVATLVANPGAKLSEAVLEKAIEKHGGDVAVKNTLANRHDLPVTIAERLVAAVSESLREYLLTKRELSADQAADLVLQARERATVALLPPGAKSTDVVDLVRQLRDHQRLSPSLILRALCLGDIGFFEASMAVLSNTSIINARALIHDEGRLGLQSLYARTGLPTPLYPAFRVAVDMVRSTQYDGGEKDRERFASKVIERVLTQYEDMDAENLDYLLRKLKQLAA